jgi:N-acetyl sugar amidotransferase
MKRPYQMCTKTVMDTTDPDISFDERGISNHYYDYQRLADRVLLPPAQRDVAFNKIVETIKKDGNRKEYDCVLGLSGGVDSSYMAYLAKKVGLRPLTIHFDNGWNSELAVKNIENIVKKLNFGLETYVINWEEFKDIQIAFLKASVPNVEVPTDHAIKAALFKIASERKIKYILSGSNIVTEGILPAAWGHQADDLKSLKSIHKKYGKVKLETFPQLSIAKYAYYLNVKKITSIRLLNYIDYNKADAIQVLEKELGWKYYGGKHYESVFTQFFQAHYLPVKFNIDKRKAHLSTLICSGQITREKALEELNTPLYDPKILEEHTVYVTKKFGFSRAEWDAILKDQPRTHEDFPSNEKLIKFLTNLKQKISG